MSTNCNHATCEGETCRRPPKQRQRSRIWPVSSKQAKRLRRYSKEKHEQFKDRPVCAVALLENKSPEVVKLFSGCTYWATQKHHPAGRIGERLYDKGVAVCGPCHSIFETRPDITKELGLSKSRLCQ